MSFVYTPLSHIVIFSLYIEYIVIGLAPGLCVPRLLVITSVPAQPLLAPLYVYHLSIGSIVCEPKLLAIRFSACATVIGSSVCISHVCCCYLSTAPLLTSSVHTHCCNWNTLKV